MPKGNPSKQEKSGLEILPRLLVLDDDKEIVEQIAVFFRESGCSVVAATNPTEALKLFDSYKHEIIFLDIKLPGIDGLQLFKKFKRKNKDVEIVIITGYGDMELAISAIRLGACDFLNKPIKRKDMLIAYDRAVEKILKRREIAKDLEEARQAISGLAKANFDEEARTYKLLRGKLEQIIYPQVESLMATVQDASTVESLYFLRELLDSIIPSSTGSTKLADIMAKLSPAEKKIAKLLVQGKNTQEIADALYRSIDTIYTHQKRIRKRLGLTNTSLSLVNYLLAPNSEERDKSG